MEFCVQPAKLKSNVSTLESSATSLKQKANAIENIKNCLSCGEYEGVKAALDTCIQDLGKESDIAKKLATVLGNACDLYVTTENRIAGNKGSASGGNGTGDNSGGQSGDSPRGWYFDSDGPNVDGNFYLDTPAKWKKKDGKVDFKSLKIGVGAKGSAYLASIGGGLDTEYFDASAGMKMFYATGGVGTGLTLFNDGRFAPGAFAEANIKGSVLHGDAKTQLGVDEYNLHANAKGDLWVAYAGASGGLGMINIKDDDGNVTGQKFGVQGEVKAGGYVAQGEVSGGFTIMGIKVNGSIGGGVGGAEFKAGGSITTGGVSGKAGIGALLGVDIGFSIDWSGFKWPWE
jgi:hypothetical protein